MMNIQDLISKIQNSTSGVVINIINTNEVVDNDTAEVDNDVEDIDTTDFDFEVDDEVMVHHVRKDGTEIFVDGVVIEVGHDDFGPYTRVRGDNGNHYKAGASLGLIRKGTRIIRKL